MHRRGAIRDIDAAWLATSNDFLRPALAPTWDWRVPCARPVIYLFSPIILSLNPHNTTLDGTTRGPQSPRDTEHVAGDTTHRLGRIPGQQALLDTPEPAARDRGTLTRETEPWEI